MEEKFDNRLVLLAVGLLVAIGASAIFMYTPKLHKSAVRYTTPGTKNVYQIPKNESVQIIMGKDTIVIINK
jgi:hypothetical protein